MPRPSRKSPGRATLHQMYIVKQLPVAALADHFAVAQITARQWLVDAGIQIRSVSSGGYKRQLTPPAREVLAQLGLEMTAPAIARRLEVSPITIRRWFAEAGLPPPVATLKNRPHGSAVPIDRPTAMQLRRLYEDDRLSIAAVARELNATVHLVRTWLREDRITIRPAGGSHGNHPPTKVRKPAPPEPELRRLREQDRLTLGQLARRYGVHPQTASRWLSAAGLPGHLPPAGPQVSDEQIAALYQQEPISGAEIARRLGVTDARVSAALRRQHISIDPARQAAAVRASAAARPQRPPLPAHLAEQAVRYYQDEGWSCRMIGEHLGVSQGKVRRELQRRGIPAHIRRLASPGGRASRAEADVARLRQLYVESEWSAADVAAHMDTTTNVVLRTGHDHGVPIRPGGQPEMGAAAGVAIIDALYNDEQVSEVLDRHAVPRRPAGGSITARFPCPVPLTAALLEDLYQGAGCSSGQIELLTGQSQAVVRSTMHRLQIPLRADRNSPALHRVRAAARKDFHAQITADYRACGSTAEIARQYGCSTRVVRRWLAEAGVTLPGRGEWDRTQRRNNHQPGTPERT